MNVQTDPNYYRKGSLKKLQKLLFDFNGFKLIFHCVPLEQQFFLLPNCCQSTATL